MTRSEVVELTARERVVERICANITHLPQGSADLQDLSQIVYIGLLDYPEPLLVDLYQKGELVYLIARMALRQVNSNRSVYAYAVRHGRQEHRFVSIDGMDFIDQQ